MRVASVVRTCPADRVVYARTAYELPDLPWLCSEYLVQARRLAAHLRCLFYPPNSFELGQGP